VKTPDDLFSELTRLAARTSFGLSEGLVFRLATAIPAIVADLTRLRAANEELERCRGMLREFVVACETEYDNGGSSIVTAARAYLAETEAATP
jgi:hypothetical protein